MLPAYIAKALKGNAKAWTYFQSLAPTHRRHFVVWIHIAKRPGTRAKRIRESIALLAAGKKLGLKYSAVRGPLSASPKTSRPDSETSGPRTSGPPTSVSA